MWRYLRYPILIVMLAVLGAGLYDRVVMIRWVGDTNLTVEFVVTDAETGEPVKGADLSILSEGGFNEDGRRLDKTELKKEEIKLTTDESGTARYVCRKSMCTGSESGLKFTNTYAFALPWWSVTPKATGYAAESAFSLNELEHVRAVKRVGPQQAKLVVPTALRKSR